MFRNQAVQSSFGSKPGVGCHEAVSLGPICMNSRVILLQKGLCSTACWRHVRCCVHAPQPVTPASEFQNPSAQRLCMEDTDHCLSPRASVSTAHLRASLPVITYQNPLTRDPSQSFPGTPGSRPGDGRLPQGFTQTGALMPAQARWHPGRSPTCSPRSRIRSPGRLHRQPSRCWCSVYCSRRSWKTTRMMLWQGNRREELSVGTKRNPPPAF